MNAILNQITYFAFFQSLLLISIFLVSAARRKRINSYLLILVCVLLLGLTVKIGGFAFGWQRQLIGISEYSILMFGPTIYLFVQSTLSERRFSRKDIIHYLPALIHSLFVTFYYILPSHEIILERANNGSLYTVIKLLVGIGLTINITYFILSILKFHQLKRSLEEEVSYYLNINFVRYFLWSIGLSLFAWLVIYLISFGDNMSLEIESRKYIWLTISLIVLFITYYQMTSPSVYQFEILTTEKKYANSKFTQIDLDELKLKLEKVMEAKKPYLNSRLLKSELAEMIEINAPELSRLLNERIGMNFFEYVNYHRIHEFIRLAKTPIIKEKTLLGVALDAGFHSKSTFNKAFKSIVGSTPSEYLKTLNP